MIDVIVVSARHCNMFRENMLPPLIGINSLLQGPPTAEYVEGLQVTLFPTDTIVMFLPVKLQGSEPNSIIPPSLSLGGFINCNGKCSSN